jgi:hypothetical protein
VLCAVDVAAVEAALSAWVLGRRAAAARAQSATGPHAADRVVLACDGKTVRGSRATEGTATALFSVFEHRHRLVLTQKAIERGNEIAAFAATLDTVGDLRGVLITADALHTQREHAEYLHRRGAHYLFTVKRNQPTLHAALAALPWAAVGRQLRRQSGHGRAETARSRCWPPTVRPASTACSARRAGDAGDPQPHRESDRQTLAGGRLRDHLPGPPLRRPRAAGRLAAEPLGDRGAVSITSAMSLTVRTPRGSAPAPGRN